MSETFLIRDVFNKDITEQVAQKISEQYTGFDREGFINYILRPLPDQTLSERTTTFTDGLIKYLSSDYPTNLNILLNCLPTPYNTDGIEGEAVNRFYVSALTKYISKAGIDHLELSLDGLYQMTKTFTAEWDIRPFIIKYPEAVFAKLSEWTNDDNSHIRRLVSEGSRPNLPWGSKLKMVVENPKGTTLPLLEKLQDDPSEYVRRSVANHLNDLAKTDADLVVATLKKWKKKNYTRDKERMLNHAIRTLVKNGHSDALALIGYDDDFDIKCEITKKTKTVLWSSIFDFEFELTNNRDTEKKLLIDYIIGFQKKDGKLKDKVFKLKKIVLPANGKIKIQKKQSFKPISTRTYYPGKHSIAIQINGKIVKKETFELQGE